VINCRPAGRSPSSVRPIDVRPLALARTLAHMGLLKVSSNAHYGWP
jgi:hypothetical protein